MNNDGQYAKLIMSIENYKDDIDENINDVNNRLIRECYVLKNSFFEHASTGIVVDVKKSESGVNNNNKIRSGNYIKNDNVVTTHVKEDNNRKSEILELENIHLYENKENDMQNGIEQNKDNFNDNNNNNIKSDNEQIFKIEVNPNDNNNENNNNNHNINKSFSFNDINNNIINNDINNKDITNNHNNNDSSFNQPNPLSSLSNPPSYLTNHIFPNTYPSLSSNITPLFSNFFPDNSSILSFKSSLDNLPLSSPSPTKNTIGPLIYEPSSQYNLHKVKNDGNCFYRSFLFSFLEQILFTNNTSLLINILSDFKSRIISISTEQPLSTSLSPPSIFSYLISKYKIDIHTTYKCLLMLLMALKSSSTNTTSKSYMTLIKMYNNNIHFDMGLIIYFHTLLYEYIKSNENKHYSKKFDIPLGNLLPKKYENENGSWNYEQFYNDYLYKLNIVAEKIIIYVTPFIFGVNLNVNLEGDIINLNNAYSKDSSLNIYLLYRDSHYNVLYEGEFFLNNKQNLCLHFYNNEHTTNTNNTRVNNDTNNIHKCFICEQNKNTYPLKKGVHVCERCFVTEILNIIKQHYHNNINTNRKYFLKQFTSYNEVYDSIKACTFEINGNKCNDVTIKDCVDMLMERNDAFSFENFVYDIKCKQCLICDYNNPKENKLAIKLPCECRVDKVKCVEMFYDYINATLPVKQHVECYCGFVYKEWNDVVMLIDIMDKCDVKCNAVVEYYADVVKHVCVICNNVFDIKDVKYCLMKINGAKVNNVVKHAVCKECIRKSQERKVDLMGIGLRCKMCNKEHYILSNNNNNK